jgi:hypothetical protein
MVLDISNWQGVQQSTRQQLSNVKGWPGAIMVLSFLDGDHEIAHNSTVSNADWRRDTHPNAFIVVKSGPNHFLNAVCLGERRGLSQCGAGDKARNHVRAPAIVMLVEARNAGGINERLSFTLGTSGKHPVEVAVDNHKRAGQEILEASLSCHLQQEAICHGFIQRQAPIVLGNTLRRSPLLIL